MSGTNMEVHAVAHFLNEDGGNYLFQCGDEVLCLPVDSVDVTSPDPLYVFHGNQIIQLEINLHPDQTQCPDRPIVTAESAPDDGTSSTWTDAASLLFISLYKEKKSLVETRKILTLKSMWEKIALEMSESKYCFTPIQCENKWKSLSRGYTNVIVNNKKTGRGKKACPYQRELTEIFEKRNNIFPPAVMGTGNPINREELMAMSGITSTTHQMASLPVGLSAATGSPLKQLTEQPTEHPSSPPMESSPPLVQPSLQKKSLAKQGRSVVNELVEMRKLIAERHTYKKSLDENKIEQHRIKNDLLRALLEEVKKRNDINDK